MSKPLNPKPLKAFGLKPLALTLQNVKPGTSELYASGLLSLEKAGRDCGSRFGLGFRV